MDLRRPRPSDAKRIADYHHRCWTEGYRGLVSPQVLDALDLKARVAMWEGMLADPPDLLLVATIDDAPVGHVLVDDVTICQVYVHPDHWREGIGRRLLAEGEAMLQQRGVEVGYLWTIEGNARAINLYESAGWVQDGTTEWHRSTMGDLIEELRMQKQLTVA